MVLNTITLILFDSISSFEANHFKFIYKVRVHKRKAKFYFELYFFSQHSGVMPLFSYAGTGGHLCLKYSSTFLAAQIQIKYQDFDSGECLDKWYPIHQTNTTIKGGDLGSIRIRARYQHEIIMPEDKYSTLKEVRKL
jgi:hypothetical protein